ncbi:MAG: C25 family cysteine peptidase [Cytophagales bacterium]|nr:C25 family cysteine peptidase [Bernardetiaceae bacterium]MDW8211409.1 C25 family cysteine peptidase [Cytophagales bacterium]
MKRSTAFLLLLAVTTLVNAQRFGNEWIDFQQTYYKIPIRAEGIYRILPADLQAAGLPVSTIDPRNIRMFFRGREIAIFVAGESDGRFDANDYIEFYGRPAWLDLAIPMYETPDHITNLYTNFYADAAYYFLTVGPTRGKRMTIVSERNPSLAPEQYHMQEITDGRAGNFANGVLFPSNIVSSLDKGGLFSHFNEGKGMVVLGARASTTITNRTYNLQDVVQPRGALVVPARATIRLAGRTNTLHEVEMFIGTTAANQRSVAKVLFQNYSVVDLNATLDSTFRFPTPSGTILLGYRVNRVERADEEVAIGHVILTYPQGFNMQGSAFRKFNLNPNANGTSRIVLTNVSGELRLIDITDEGNARLMSGENVSGGISFVIPNTTNGRKLYADTRINRPTGITRINFRRLPVETADYLIVTHPYLRRPAGNIPDPVQAYANYRASAKGGSYRPLVVEVGELFDQFSEGEPTPLAIRRFADYALTHGNPKFLFLVGKGLQIEHFYYYNPSTTMVTWPQVPPYGSPGSDHELTAGLANFPKHVPAIPTGRLPAANSQQVVNYLNKVIEYEEFAFDDLWKKNVLHLSGGFSASEHALFRAYTDGFAQVARGEFLGARVETVSKNTTDFVEFINIRDQVNRGVGLITFYGHAALDFADIDIGRASNLSHGYNNRRRYPMVIVNGCGSGDVFQQTSSMAEDWLLTPERGAILWLAHGHLGFAGPLRFYTQVFYENVLGKRENINLPIGRAMQNFLTDYLRRSPVDFSIANAQQFVLCGDPAIYLFKAPMPDYAISKDKIFIKSFNNIRVITAQADSFRIGIVVSNFGITDRNPLTVSVRRTYADGSIDVLPIQSFNPVYYQDTLYFTVVNPRNAQNRIAGLNRFEIMVDAENRVAELREDNNTAIFEFLFLRGTMIPLAPKEFSIVSRSRVPFIAQNSDPFSAERRYRFQLDTSYLFNSSLRRDTTVFGYVTAQWTTQLPNVPDSTVFYWRVRYADPRADEDTAWAESSFVYIPRSPDGWSQSRHPQFRKNDFKGIELDLQRRKMHFKDITLTITGTAYGSSNPNVNNFFLNVNGQPLITGNCALNQPSRFCVPAQSTDRLLVTAIDAETGQFYRPDIGMDACGSSLLVAAIDQCELQRWNVLERTLREVKTGDYVIVMNSRFVHYNAWWQINIDALGSIGANVANFRSRYPSGAPMIIIGRKGAPQGTAIEAFAGSPAGQASINHTLRFTFNSGTITSTLIGPAAEWGNLLRLINNAENPQRESWQLDVIGVDFQGNERVVFNNVGQDNFPLRDLNPAQVPYLRLRLKVTDSVNRTPYQLQRWQVIYKEVPEGILLYDTLTYRENTVLNIIEGDTAQVGFYFLNISGNDFGDSLVVDCQIENTVTGASTLRRFRIAAPKRNEHTYFRIPIPSLELLGENRMTVTVNPRVQAEQFYENNTLQVRFRTKPDDINPVLDVAIDGRQIMDGEIVSPTPFIVITLKDENKRFIKRDTTGWEVRLGLNTPNADMRRLNFNDPNLTWYVDASGRFVIQYRSPKLANGTYLLTVQARDAAGNPSGKEPYRITFRVVNETTVTNFYPYPNPFSTSVRFVFTLTGEIPEDIRIQIMTVSGKVVKTIFKEDLGPLRIGTNVSQYAWDGTDDFGDQLARGVYLYKVDVRKANGEEFSHRATAGDELFKHGYGKLYLMR